MGIIFVIEKLNCGYEKTILRDISFTGERGDIICILGSNGSGKSTLIKTLVGLLEPHGGKVSLKKENTKDWAWRKRAKHIAYIPQSFNSTFQYSGLEVVVMGRTSYLGFGRSPGRQDYSIAEKAMKKLKIIHLKNKVYANMSGGERQLVKIAQALAQEAEILVMDEPTNNLDYGNQISMLKYLKELSQMGILIIMATHFPDQALSYGTKALLISQGRGKFISNPKESITEEDLKCLYNLDMKILDLRINNKNRRICVPF